MSDGSYYLPEYGAKAFTCPFCSAYAEVDWIHISNNAFRPVSAARCKVCRNLSYWFTDSGPSGFEFKMFFPAVQKAPLPHSDMPEDAKQDYMEARAVMGVSSKAAAALLRLSLQRLCIALGKSSNINKAIGELVSDGLPRQVQQALDAVRIIGNESVHPGEILPEDLDLNIGKVFDLMNFIVQDRITRFKEIEALYQSLPESKREGVEKRDGTGSRSTDQ